VMHKGYVFQQRMAGILAGLDVSPHVDEEEPKQGRRFVWCSQLVNANSSLTCDHFGSSKCAHKVCLLDKHPQYDLCDVPRQI
jgi:hypothetical protein